ncbi:MAG TPA: hypothetical protein VF604_18645 [Pyrinomonadaceae bacterium]|jgi:hypothetical protein
MSSSIYHFFKDLVEKKALLKDCENLENFPFNNNLISFTRKTLFPDIGIKVCKNDELFEGGELVEIKDARNFIISSFNSTFPKGEKEIKSIVKIKSEARKQMKIAGEDLEDLPIRQIYYLIRGSKQHHSKVILVHGSFFEVNSTDDLIAKSFVKVLEENLKRNGFEIDDEIERLMKKFSPQQSDFSKTRQIENYPISVRFRIMTAASPESNLLNSAKYKQIEDDSINFILSFNKDEDKAKIEERMFDVFGDSFYSFKSFTLEHSYNGNFLVFQQAI